MDFELIFTLEAKETLSSFQLKFRLTTMGCCEEKTIKAYFRAFSLAMNN